MFGLAGIFNIHDEHLVHAPLHNFAMMSPISMPSKLLT
jgi:hypothetical protein